ncbi:hypothetical protein L0U95_24050 (plasmid) [Burkholderia cenocepacia]|uniref:hypothetical protein n=1 Tax=Burkholderia cenocepacia TaxID=95486 RepID=UPI001F32FEA2|nr:hypothetical protein [Burkholderia cenocepacia]UJH75013.1 hypothetical protein L0U95_24050 [Burkholderia cenocepacia]
MKEPILSREEVLELAVDAFGIDYDRLDARFEKYAAALESALLEKLCGEPVAYTSEDGLRLLSSDEEICVWAPDSPLRRQRDIPLYTLKDRQS